MFSDELVFFLIKLGICLGAIVIALIVLKLAIRIIKKILSKTSFDAALHTFVINGIKVLFFVIMAIAVLEYFGFDTKSLLTLLGVSGAAIALALKDSLSNVAGGLIIIATKPFSRDDYVDINGTMGTVSEIDLLVTTLVTFDNKVITMPNGLVSTSIITNFSKANTRRVDCAFGISYDSDVAKAKEIMIEVANANPLIKSDIPPVVGVASNSESAVVIDFKVWTDTDNYWPVKYYLEENIKLAFDKDGIKIPYPTVEVKMDKSI